MIEWMSSWWSARRFRSAMKARAGFKETNKQLKRIADALEVVCLEQYGYYLSEPRVDTSGRPPETFDTDSERMAIEEMLGRMGFPPEAMMGGSDGEDAEDEDDTYPPEVPGPGPSYHPV